MAKDDKLDKNLSPEVQQLQDLYDVMVEKGLDAIELKDEDIRIKLTRRFAGASPSAGPVHAVRHHAAPAPVTPAEIPSAQTIPTPLAGVFYRASSPTSAPFAKEGDSVDAGQTLCIVEAMKVMNEIKSEAACRIVKILVENGRPVTAGQPLFQFEPV